MAKIGVSLKIDVTKIDKARLFQGAKGTYLDATVFIDVDQLDQYGNSGMITQDVTKAEKQQQVKGAILGNCKVFWNEQPQTQQPLTPQRPAPQKPSSAPAPQPQQNLTTPDLDDGWDDDIPF